MDIEPNGQDRLADQRSLRRHNLRLILRHIFEHGPRSRATISSATGLNRSTVSSLTAELIDRGLLVERGSAAKGAVGRPSQTLEVGAKLAALGIEFLADRTTLCAVDLGGRVRHSLVAEREHPEVAPEQAVDEIVSLVTAAMSVIAQREFKVVGLAVGVPGLVDLSGTVVSAPRFAWEMFPLGDVLRERLRATFPVHVENTANLGALAELAEGVGARFDDFLYLFGDDGTEVGIVIGGEVVRGRTGFAGELGHTVIDPGGRRCICGNRGCLDTVASRQALLDRAGVVARGDGLDSLIRLARAANPEALGAIEAASSAIARTIAPICGLLSPQVVVLAGDAAELGEWLIGDLDEQLATTSLAARWSRTGVVTAHVPTQAAARGGAHLILRRIYDDPTIVPRRSEEAAPRAEGADSSPASAAS